MKRFGLVVLAAILTSAACAKPAGEATSATSPTVAGPTVASTESPSTSATETSAADRLALEDCPVDDEAFCDVAVVMVNAIAIGDVEAIVELSRPNVYDCGGIQYDFFPECVTTDVVLEGYIFSTGAFPTTLEIEVLSEADYRGRLEMLFASVDASFSDEYGGGGPTVLGIKGCGGWTITWTVAVSDAGAPAERMGAFFEFVIEDLESDEWYTEGLLLQPLTCPEGTFCEGDPFDNIACDEVAVPWPS